MPGMVWDSVEGADRDFGSWGGLSAADAMRSSLQPLLVDMGCGGVLALLSGWRVMTQGSTR
jgi:hypothetical protein